MNKTIIFRGNHWDKTIIRYANPQATMQLHSDATVLLPPTIMYSPESPSQYLPNTETGDFTQVAGDILDGKIETISKYWNPISYTLKEGDTIGPYTIIQKIGEGAFSKVYKIKHYLKKDPEAVKIINPSSFGALDKASILQRFEYEYEIGQIESEFIVKSKAKGFIYQHPYIVSEIADGGDLGQLNMKDLSIDFINKLAFEVLTGLSDIHKCNIIHRDIKPQNIFLCGEKFKIGDFGASISSDKDQKTNALQSNIFGTHGYIAPELFSSESPQHLSQQQDIFSFGCLIFQFITGVLPFGQITSREDIQHYSYNSMNGVFRSIRHYRKDVPGFWEDVVYGCLEADQDKRFKSVDDILKIIKTNTKKEDYFTTKVSDKVSFYDYDLVFSFSNKNRFLAIELLAFLQNKGISIVLNTDIFTEANTHSIKNTIKAKYHLVLHTPEFTDELARMQHQLDACEGFILYGDKNLNSNLSEDKNTLKVDSKIQILELIEGWRNENSDSANLAGSALLDLKHKLLQLISNNKLAEVVATFLEHLNSSRGNDDVKTSLYAISSRMKSLKKERINDTISHEEAQRSENKIVLSLNSLIFDYFQV